jgi:hypothetical protein
LINNEIIKRAGFDKLEQLEDNIFYIKNFMSKEDIAVAYSIISNLSEQDWSILDNELVEDWKGKFYDHNNNKLNNSLRSKVDRFASIFKDYKIIGYNRILRQPPGANMVAHIDPINDIGNGSKREYAAIIYLNDNYDGGEISYINFGIKIKPEAGSLIIFKTGPDYLHEVLEVSGNTPRYCLPGFIFSSWPSSD